MKITAQDYIIQAILDCLEDTIQGKGIKLLNDVVYNLNKTNSYIRFTPKDGREFRSVDAFWLGFMVKEFL